MFPQKKNRWASGGQHAKGQPPAPPIGLNYAPATASRAYIANLDILDRHGRSGYLLRPPAHAQCRHRHPGPMWGPHPGPSGRPAAAGGLPWPMPGWGRAVGRVLGGGQMSFVRTNQIRMPEKPVLFSCILNVCSTKLPCEGTDSNPATHAATDADEIF
jgi:hypothetical protein